MLRIEVEKLGIQRSRNEPKELGRVLFSWTLGPETEGSGNVGTAVNSVFACQY